MPSIGPTERVFGATLSMSTPFWLYWSQIAIEGEHSASLHRQAADKASPGPAMIEETKASMVAITACAHALDAFCGKFAEDIMPPGLLKNWQDGRGIRAYQIWDSLRHGFNVKTHPWKKEIVWLFQDRRNPALHHGEQAQATVSHPLAPNTAPEMVKYSVEASRRAVDLILEVFDKCSAVPKPSAAKRAEGIRPQVEGLIALRSSLQDRRNSKQWAFALRFPWLGRFFRFQP